jgi:hypothetical protein
MYQLKELPKTGYCCYCKIDKQASEFYMRRKGSFSLMSCCKKCQNERAIANRRKRYEAGKESVEKNLEAIREWARRNPDRAKASALAAGRRYQKRNSKALTDKWIIKNCFGGDASTPGEMIALKRAALLSKRIVKRIRGRNEKQNC